MKELVKNFKKWANRRELNGTPFWKALIFQKRIPIRYKNFIIFKLIYRLLINLRLRLWKIRDYYEKKNYIRFTNNFEIKDEKGHNRPNIILIVLDTVRAQDLPMYGGKAEMPFLSKFAKYATVYKNAYSAANWTNPSHASLFTGCYHTTHGIITGLHKLNESLPTMAELLKKEGYNTFCLTDNHLICKENNLSKGFDYYLHTHDEFGGVENKINKFLPLFKKKSFFLFINFMTCHLPYLINPSFFKNLTKKEIKIISIYNSQKWPNTKKININSRKYIYLKTIWHKAYLSALSYLDFQLAKLFIKLDEQNLLSNALIIITSDHGEDIFDHPIEITKNKYYYFLVHGAGCYNTMIKIPLLFKHTNKQIKESYKLINNIDILPTLFDELKIKINHKIDGISIFKSKRDFIFSLSSSKLNCESLIKGNFKIIKYPNKVELFNIKLDPHEKNPIYNETIEKKLLRQLNNLNKNISKVISRKLNDSDEKLMKKKLKSLGYI